MTEDTKQRKGCLKTIPLDELSKDALIAVIMDQRKMLKVSARTVSILKAERARAWANR